jgi:hypothetical protein
MKLVAADMNRQRIALIYSDPDKNEIVTHEFSLDDPELESKLMPHMKEPLLRKHLEKHPDLLKKKPEGRGS